MVDGVSRDDDKHENERDDADDQVAGVDLRILWQQRVRQHNCFSLRRVGTVRTQLPSLGLVPAPKLTGVTSPDGIPRSTGVTHLRHRTGHRVTGQAFFGGDQPTRPVA